ncbi:unnamed protein product [Effrenium voratum]|uniref:E3 ubiquitin-protein ligase RNF216 RING finger HC subclass domain-containing protein n=1 Tax=Effrenium voratum TaxID=2562239 RepID=A0AA36HR72_9DINO|nr:unnamed protein product [Effrenium voratum]
MATWQQIREDEELARRLAEELAGPDAEARAQIYDEDLALARQLAEQEQADLEFAAPAKAVFAVDDSPPTKKRRAPSTDLDPVLSDTKEELSDMAKEEVENMWSRCLRGEELLDSLPANDNASSEAYAVHALHTLMSEFRRAPVAMIRSAFQQAGTYSEAKAIIEGSSEVTSLKSKRPPKAAPPCDVPPLLQKEVQLGGEAVSIHKALAKRKQVRQERVAQLKAVGGLGTCGCCFDDELLPEEELRCTAAKGHGFCIPCVKQAAMAFFGQGLFTLNLSSEAASSAEPNLSVASLRCLDTSNCPGHFLDTAMQKALPRKDYVRYSRRSAALQAAASGLKDLVSCPGCDFMVQMSDKNETFPLDTPPPEDGVVRTARQRSGPSWRRRWPRLCFAGAQTRSARSPTRGRRAAITSGAPAARTAATSAARSWIRSGPTTTTRMDIWAAGRTTPTRGALCMEHQSGQRHLARSSERTRRRPCSSISKRTPTSRKWQPPPAPRRGRGSGSCLRLRRSGATRRPRLPRTPSRSSRLA